MDRRLLPLTTAILVVACQAGPGSSPGPAASSQDPASSGEPNVSPTAAPSAPPVPLASGPDMTVTLVGHEPVITRGDGPPNADAVMPAAAAVDADGSIVAFLVWFGPAGQRVTAARSTDGRSWSIDPTPIYTDLGLTLAPPGAIPGAALRGIDGTWVLYGWAARPADRTSFETWRATAPTPDGPWTIADGEDRVLARGANGAWDDQTAAASSILAEGPELSMWYEGQGAGRGVRGGIGYASSVDGVTWARRDDPVVGPGDCGPATAAASLGPQVWRRGDGYLMLFAGSAGPSEKPEVLAATSDDGIHWSCTGKVLLAAADIPGSEGVESIQGTTLDGEPVLLVESLSDGGSDIWLATVVVDP